MASNVQDLPFVTINGVLFINPPAYDKQQKGMENLIGKIREPNHLDYALAKLVNEYRFVPNLGNLLWIYPGVTDLFLEQIISLSQKIDHPEYLCTCEIRRVHNIITLIKVMSTIPGQTLTLNALNIYQSMYPFLQTLYKNKEYLRLQVAVLHCFLVAMSETRIIIHFYQTNLISKLLTAIPNRERTIEELSLQLLLTMLRSDIVFYKVMDVNITYNQVLNILNQVIVNLRQRRSAAVLQWVVLIYIRFADAYRGYNALRNGLPADLRNNTFDDLTSQDPELAGRIRELLTKLQLNQE